MSRKHNTPHDRVRSHYPDRLEKRGESNVTVRMIPLDQLRRNAIRRGEGIAEELTEGDVDA